MCYAKSYVAFVEACAIAGERMILLGQEPAGTFIPF
jgi:hypothetical protein